MKRKWALFLLVITFLSVSVAGAATPESFRVETARDLLKLCSTAPSNPLYKEAIHFCHGFLVGAYAHHEAKNSGPEGRLLVCLPDPAPSRNDMVFMFVDWLKAHPQYLDEKPVDAEFRFLMEKWSCRH